MFWLVQSAADCTSPPQAWLTPAEQAQFAALKSDKRRRDWLLGRWTAKRLLQAVLAQTLGGCPPLTALTLHKAGDGAPFATWDFGGPGAWGACLSLSHAGDQAFCALTREPIPLGADIERVEPRPAEFVNDYFTEAEIAWVRRSPPFTRDVLVTAIWSAKEAALKALRLGLTVDTRAVTCRIKPVRYGPLAWTPFEIESHAARLPRPAPALTGWWRTIGDCVLTLACAAQRCGSPARFSENVRIAE